MENTKYTKKIVEVLLDVGIPASLKGYGCLKAAIELVLRDSGYIRDITKRLYPAIAEECGTTAGRAERAIRHAIEVAFNNMEPEQIERYFGHCYNYHKGKIANSEFVAILAERVLVEVGGYDLKAN